MALAIMTSSTYETIWQDSQKVTWQVSDLIGPDKPLDFNRPFLPESIARVEEIMCLKKEEKQILNHIRGNSYLHLFVLVEQFIIPMVMDQIRRIGYGDIYSIRALLGFSEEEGKHIHLFQQFAKAFGQGMGSTCDCIESTEAIAARILEHHPLGVLFMTLQFEWTTQSHYLESIRNNRHEKLDPRFCDLLRCHWLEESQHTKLDALLIDELTAHMTHKDIDRAIADYFKIVQLLHDVLMEQVQLDIISLERVIGRRFTDSEKQEILQVQQQAYCWAFLCAGLSHPNFVSVLGKISPSGKAEAIELAKAWS